MLRNKVVIDTPDELYDKLSILSVNLPDNAKAWPIQLCSSYLNALISDLSEHVTTNSGFVMPDLTSLISKDLQLAALRSVRTYAASSFKLL